MRQKEFPVSSVLMVATGRLLYDDGMDEIYEILNFMTNDNLLTHQLPRAFKECKPHVLKRYPAMKAASAELSEKLDGVNDTETKRQILTEWLAVQTAQFGKMLKVEQIPTEEHAVKDPLSEPIEVRSKKR